MSRRTILIPIVVGLVASLTVATHAALPAAGGGEGIEPVPALRIEGRGHGHGIGLSQWGAYTLARQGATYADILATFYPGTTLGTAEGEVAVTVDRRSQVRIAFPAGGELRSSRSGANPAPGFPISVAPGSTMIVRPIAAGYEVVGATAPAHSGEAIAYQPAQECLLLCETTTTTTTTTPAPDDDPHPDGDTHPDGDAGEDPPGDSGSEGTEPPGIAPAHPVSPAPVWAVPVEGGTVQSVDRGRTYRGLFEVAGAEGGVALRNHVDIESYLLGIAEVPGTWPAEALAAQSIAARTFALRAGSLCDSERCQVYVGTAGESPGQAAAVNATRGIVVTYHGGLAATHYSASAGGISATPAEGFGLSSEIPYLQAIEHPDANPQPWQRDVALADIRRAFNYPGEVRDVRVDEVGPSGRALAITIRGDAGPVAVDPHDFRRQMGLRSSLYELTIVNVGEPPPIPRVDGLPDVVGNPMIEAVPSPPLAGPWVTFGAPDPTPAAVRGLPLAAAVGALAFVICLWALRARGRPADRVAPWRHRFRR